MTSYRVEIFGQPYSLRADADERHIEEVARLVDQKMREVAEGSRSVSTVQIAVLAALDIASEYLQAGAQDRGLADEVASRCEEMVRRIDECLPEFRTA